MQRLSAGKLPWEVPCCGAAGAGNLQSRRGTRYNHKHLLLFRFALQVKKRAYTFGAFIHWVSAAAVKFQSASLEA